MKKRVVIPIKNKQLCENFDECSYYEIFEISGDKVSCVETKSFEKADLSKIFIWFEEKKITDIVAFKINPEIINLSISGKINLFVGVPVKTSFELIEDYILGKLESDEKIIYEITHFSK